MQTEIIKEHISPARIERLVFEKKLTGAYVLVGGDEEYKPYVTSPGRKYPSGSNHTGELRIGETLNPGFCVLRLLGVHMVSKNNLPRGFCNPKP